MTLVGHTGENYICPYIDYTIPVPQKQLLLLILLLLLLLLPPLLQHCRYYYYYYYYYIYHLYNYVPEKNHVTKVYSVAVGMYLQFVLHVMLLCMLNMLCIFTLVLSIVCVQCSVWLLLYFLDFMLSQYVSLLLSECF
jgi:hypothetical protein